MSRMPPVEVTTGESLPFTPRLAILGLALTVGPYTGPAEHERHVLETIGSGNWYPSEFDEFRFDRSTGELRSLRLHIPEQNVSSARTSMPVEEGTIRLTEIAAFDQDAAATRWASPAGDQLMCLYNDSLPPVIRVRVAPSFELLVADGEIHGWSLSDPSRFLVNGWEFPEPGDDPGLAALLKEYFDLVADPNIERIEDQDPDALKALRSLAERIDVRAGVIQRRKALLAKVNDMIDFFYD